LNDFFTSCNIWKFQMPEELKINFKDSIKYHRAFVPLIKLIFIHLYFAMGKNIETQQFALVFWSPNLLP